MSFLRRPFSAGKFHDQRDKQTKWNRIFRCALRMPAVGYRPLIHSAWFRFICLAANLHLNETDNSQRWNQETALEMTNNRPETAVANVGRSSAANRASRFISSRWSWRRAPHKDGGPFLATDVVRKLPARGENQRDDK